MKTWTIQTEYVVKGGDWVSFGDHATTTRRPKLDIEDMADELLGRWHSYIGEWHSAAIEKPVFYRLCVYECDADIGEMKLLDSVFITAIEFAVEDK